MNMFKTYLLLVAMIALLTFLGMGLDRVLGTSYLMFVFFGLSLVTTWVSYFYSDRIVLKLYGAREVSPAEAPGLHEMVERLARAAGIPKPKVAVIPLAMPNAFATGRSPDRGVVACTEGIMRLMTRDQLEGVIAHEIAHIRNRDTLISTVAATIAGLIGMVSHLFMWGGGMRGDGENQPNPLAVVGLFLAALLAPFAAMLIQMAISRTREFAADESAAMFTGNPEGLASALERLEASMRAGVDPEAVTAGTQHMFIVNPLSGGGSMMEWFSTHPSTEKRVARLRAMSRDLMMGRGAVAAGRAGAFR
jgi:heat shock protein HtpX